MGDITGPISSLPGAAHHLPPGKTCDQHPDRAAVARIQGETDSFGCELNDMCAECLAAYRAYARSEEARSGRCDWCEAEAPDLRDTRDHEEGVSGRVYRVCGACRRRTDERLRAEAAEFEDQHGCDGDLDGEGPF